MLSMIRAGTRIICMMTLALFATSAVARAVPPLANGQGVSCQTCHTTFPGMTAYGMMTMMSNFQNLDWRKQHEALPVAVRVQIASFLSNKDRPGSTIAQTMSLFAAGFLGRTMTYYLEQPFVDAGQPGTTEQMWLAWNGLFKGANSLQVGKYHTPFPFMPAHGWTLSDYLLATQDSGQNTFEPNASHWGVSLNGMSNEFMYNVAYLAGEDPVQHAFDYNRADGPRTLDFNLSYGGMSKPYTVGIVAMRGTAPLRDDNKRFVDVDPFTREGLYYGYQTPKYYVQTMYYRGFDDRPDVGASPAPLTGYMLEVQRDFGWRNHVLARYDVGSSDTLNRQYVLSIAHHVLPNLKLTAEMMASPQNRPVLGFAVDWAGPFRQGSRFLLRPLSLAPAVAAAAPAATPDPASAPAPVGDANAGAKLVQSSGCMGCHGAKFEGKIGPALYGIEHRRSAPQIASAIKNPRAPMPNFGFSDAQIGDIVAYLSNLDGGAGHDAPVVSFDPVAPTDRATMTVHFAGAAPKNVTARAVMHMGTGTHHTDIAMKATADPHFWQGDVRFTMGGPWDIEITYDGKVLDVPLSVGP